MLYIKDSKTGICQDLAKWIREKDGIIDKEYLYELERIYDEIDDAIANSDENEEVIEELELKVGSLEDDVSRLENESERLAEKIVKLEDENSALEDKIGENSELKDRLSSYMSDIKNILEHDNVEVKDVIKKIDKIMDNIDSVLY